MASQESSSKQATRLSLDEFTDATYNSILRAVEARKRPFPGPILFGFIWWPEGQGEPGVFKGGPPQGPGQ
jgi:hypothetical protein